MGNWGEGAGDIVPGPFCRMGPDTKLLALMIIGETFVAAQRNSVRALLKKDVNT